MLAEVGWGPDAEQCRSSGIATLVVNLSTFVSMFGQLIRNESSISPPSGPDHCRKIIIFLSFPYSEVGKPAIFFRIWGLYESLPLCGAAVRLDDGRKSPTCRTNTVGGMPR